MNDHDTGGIVAAIRSRLRFGVGRVATKAAGAILRTVQFMPGWVRDPVRDFTIRSLVDFGYRNSAVYACIRVIAESFPEPELHVWERVEGGDRVIVEDHPARALLASPNPHMAEDEFWEFCITYAAVGGNFYVWKQRDRLGVPVALWPFHDGQISPVMDSSAWISHYELDIGDGKRVAIRGEDIVHWRWSVDPRQPQVGISPIVAAARQVDTDSEMGRYVHALAYNDAVPRTILKTKLGFDSPQLGALKEQWKESFGGTGRGDVAVISDTDATIERVGANLAELAVEAIHNIPESRIAAVFGGAPVGYLAGLNVHLQRSTFSNYAAAERALHTRVLSAKWRSVAATMTRALLADFTDNPALVLAFDTSSLVALATERAESETHAATMYTAGLWSRNEARARTGKVALADDVVLEPAGALTVPVVYADDVTAIAAADALAANEAASPDLSLNGSQIVSLLEMIGRIGNGPGQLPRETVVELIVTAFSIPRERIEVILASIPDSGIGASLPPPPPAPALGATKGGRVYRYKAAPLPARRPSDSAVIRDQLQARRRLEREFEDAILDALAEDKAAVLAALRNGGGS